MVELIVRLALIGAGFVVALTTGALSVERSGPVLAGAAVYSALVFVVTKVGKRNSGIAGFIAVFDALFVATLLSHAGEIDRFGFVVLAPMMWASGRYGSDASFMAPLVAAAVMVSGNFFSEASFSLPMLLHSLGILGVGLLTSNKQTIVKETIKEVSSTETVAVENPADEALRQNVRALRAQIREMERETAKERTAVTLWKAVNDSNDPPIHVLLAKTVETVDVAGGALYTFSAADDRLVLESSSGYIPEAVRTTAFEVSRGHGEGQTRHRIEKELLALRDTDRLVQAGCVMLKKAGKLVGMVTLFDDRVGKLDTALADVAASADVLAGIVVAEARRQSEQLRLVEVETLYSVASLAVGAETQATLAARVLREIGESLRTDHLAFYVLDGDEAIRLASTGTDNRLFESVEWDAVSGVEGWVAAGCPETVLADTFDDDRVDKTLALKSRVGSYAVVPVAFNETPYGFLTVGTQRAGGIGSDTMATVRTLTAEFAHALGRLECKGRDAEGVMTPEEFYSAVRKGKSGHLVYLEVLHRDDAVEKFGAPAFDLALRRLVRRLRAKLPVGGAVCRRDEGDYVAFLPSTDEAYVRQWANETAALASMIPLTTPDGRSKVPLGLRAKVAPFSPQKNRISGSQVA